MMQQAQHAVQQQQRALMHQQLQMMQQGQPPPLDAPASPTADDIVDEPLSPDEPLEAFTSGNSAQPIPIATTREDTPTMRAHSGASGGVVDPVAALSRTSSSGASGVVLAGELSPELAIDTGMDNV